MTRSEAIAFLAAAEVQLLEEFAWNESQRRRAMSECHDALRALGVTDQEIESYA